MDGGVVTMTPAGKDRQTRVRATRGFDVSWSPDGKKLLLGDNRGNAYISTARERKSIATAAHDPVWSPDGGLIAYLTTTSDAYDDALVVLRADGKHARLYKLPPTPRPYDQRYYEGPTWRPQR
jgi:Tol biopolymer transport system component